MSIGERIRKLRKVLDLTQQEFSDRIGVKRNTIAKYETNRGEPIDAVVSLICREFRVNEEWLRFGTGEMLRADCSDELEALAEKYHLSHHMYVLIEKMVNLPESIREDVVTWILDLAQAMGDTPRGTPGWVDHTSSVPPREPTMAEMAAEIAELKRQLAAVTGGTVDDADDVLDEDDEAMADRARELFLAQRRSEERRESSASSASGFDAG